MSKGSDTRRIGVGRSLSTESDPGSASIGGWHNSRSSIRMTVAWAIQVSADRTRSNQIPKARAMSAADRDETNKENP